MSKRYPQWARRLVRLARIRHLEEELEMQRTVLHGVFSRQIRRIVDDWESSGMVREETLSILRESYNDLAPKSEQWGVGPQQTARPQELPGQGQSGQPTQQDIAALVRQEIAKAQQKERPISQSGGASASPSPGNSTTVWRTGASLDASSDQPNTPLPPPPPGQGPGYPLPVPSLAELQRQIDERRAKGER